MLKTYQSSADSPGLKLGEALDRKCTLETLSTIKMNTESPVNLLSGFKIHFTPESKGWDQDSEQSVDSAKLKRR